MRSLIALLVLLSSVASLLGCTSLYFRTLEESPQIPAQNPSAWPWQEYWTGIVFNGEKIGFSRQHFIPEHDQFRITSEAALRLRFLMIDKELAFVSDDWVDENLQLKRFEYEFKMDNSRRMVKGFAQGNHLKLEVGDGHHFDEQLLPYEGEVIPMNAIYLYPVSQGLQVGKVYKFQVFDGESLTIHPVEQKIVAFQSSELFTEKAFKLETELMGLSTTTWIDTKGLPQFELSLSGVMISALENEHRAKNYLTQAALSKHDHLLSYSLIPVDKEINNPRSLATMKIRLSGMPDTFHVINTAHQTCNQEDNAWLCNTLNYADPSITDQKTPAVNMKKYLQPSVTINSQYDEIRQLAKEITANTNNPNEQVAQILIWLDKNIEKQAVDSFSSLDVLKQREAECQGHSFLFSAFARSLEIPTRIINGVVYSQEHEGFLYHTWVESFIDGRWQAIDPTFGQRHADATHIALLEGEALADLIPLISLIGKLKIDVVE
jgi:hypothetical protein